MTDEPTGISGSASAIAEPAGFCPYCGQPHSVRAVFCGNCGRRMDDVTVTASPAPPVATAAEPVGLRPAGFWARLAAFAIDVFVITLAASFASAALGAGAYSLVFILGAPVYMIAWECSSYQATPGKLVLKLKVVDSRGMRLGAGIAVARTIASVLTYFTMGVGFVMLAFRKDRCALHDLVSGTRAVGRTQR